MCAILPHPQGLMHAPRFERMLFLVSPMHRKAAFGGFGWRHLFWLDRTLLDCAHHLQYHSLVMVGAPVGARWSAHPRHPRSSHGRQHFADAHALPRQGVTANLVLFDLMNFLFTCHWTESTIGSLLFAWLMSVPFHRTQCEHVGA